MMEAPRWVRSVFTEIRQDPTMSSGMEAMKERAGEFGSLLEAQLSGIYCDPKAKEHFDRKLDEHWSRAKLPKKPPEEVIVGAGLHAAIYSAVRVKRGFAKPLVLERKPRVGGVFAISQGSTFFLNSRNRPGRLGVPGRGEALNYLPEGAVQPAGLTGDEYQPNGALAFSIRSTLAMCAEVVPGVEVESSKLGASVSGLFGDSPPKRIIYAGGLGKEIEPDELKCDGEKLMTYLQFLAHLDKPSPLRGMKRIAVVGGGDAGRTVIEALIGQGPAARLTVNSLDYVEKIDWYGVSPDCMTQENWEQNNRSRYAGIGRAMPKPGASGRPINPIARRAENVGVGYQGAYVDGALYDCVIWAVGFKPERRIAQPYMVGGRVVATQTDSNAGGVNVERFMVGPAARLTFDRAPNIPEGIPENAVAIFEYADRTATLAATLPGKNASEPLVFDNPAATQEIYDPAEYEAERVDKTKPENWAVGDLLERIDDGIKCRIVVKNALKIRVSSDDDEERGFGIVVENWRYYEGDKSNPEDWQPGDWISYGGKSGRERAAEVFFVEPRKGMGPRVTITKEAGGRSALRTISASLWSYVGASEPTN